MISPPRNPPEGAEDFARLPPPASRLSRIRRLLAALAAWALYALLPAAIALGGLEGFVGYERDRREQTALQSMERRLKALREAITHETDRPRIAREAVDAFTALAELDEPAARAARAALEARHPGMLHLAVLRARPGEPLALVHADPGRPATLLPFVANHLFSRGWTASLGVRDLPRQADLAKPTYRNKQALAERTLFGSSHTLSFLAERDGELFKETGRGRAEHFYWTPIFRGGRRSGEALAGALLLFIDDARFRAAHAPALLVARADLAARAAQGFRIGLFSGERTLEAHLAAADPTLPAAREADADGVARLRGGTALAVTLRLSPAREEILAAWTSRHVAYPAAAATLAAGRALAALLCAAALGFALLAGTGVFSPFIPVRARLVALFLLAALPPLAIILSFGFRSLQDRETVLERETFDRLRSRIATIDEEVRRDRATLRERFDAMVAHSALAGRASTTELDLPGFAAAMEELVVEGRVDEFSIVDDTGNYIHKLRKYSTHPVLMHVMPKLCVMIQRYTNDPTYKPDFGSLSGNDDSLASLFFANKFDFADQMVRNVGELHPFRFLDWNYTLYMRPVLSPAGRAIATVLVVVDLDIVHFAALRRILERGAGEAGVAAFLSTRHRTRHHPADGSLDAGELRGLLDRAAAERAPVQGFLRIADASTGEVLACAAPLKEAENYILAATVPAAGIRDELDWNLRLFQLILLAVAGCAAVVGLALARSLVRPIRSLRDGVEAVARGDLERRVEIGSRDEFGLLAESFNGMVAGLREKARMSRYVSEFVRDAVRADGADAHAGEGVRRKGTILFSDLRDFTTLSEAHPPEEIVRMLNDYLGRMTVEIQRFGGVVDKFIGDAVMAVFPPRPDETAGDEARALRAALAMRDALARFNAARRAAGLFEVENGIGINTGTVIHGAIGAREHRVDLTVVGDAVNIAARLESLSKDGKHTRVIVSGATLAACPGMVEVADLGDLSVKGKRAPVRAYEVVRLLPAAPPPSADAPGGENNG